MKKYIALILVVVIFVTLACGCGSTNVAKAGSKDIQLSEVDISQFPDAYEYDVYSWPTFGLATEIPVPTWSNRGYIMFDEEDRFSCDVGYTTVENFNNYKKALQDAGFVVNYKNSSYAYYAETETGLAVLVIYSDYWYELGIAVGRNEYFEELRDYVA